MKKFQVLLYVASIVVAVGIGQVGQTGDTDSSNKRGANSDCKYKGYDNGSFCSSDSLTKDNCTSGSFKLMIFNGTAYRAKKNALGGIKTIQHGNCSGNIFCSTPYTNDLTADDCGV